jgi:hypothetical protein
VNLQIEFWQLMAFGAGLLSGFAGIVYGAGRLIAGQYELRMSERFEAMRTDRASEESRTNERFDLLQRAREAEVTGITNLEREFMHFKADLPLHYVRREDYVRGQSIVEAKLDGLAAKIDNAQLRASMTERGSP